MISAAQWLLRSAPDDLQVVYLLASNEVPSCDWDDLRRDYSGYYHPGLDARHQAMLAARGEWRGRGFCAVIEANLPENERAAVAAHELAHYLADKADADLEAVQTASIAGILARPRLAARPPDPMTLPDQEREFHDLRFNRAACHLVYRLQLNGFNIHPDGVGVCGHVITERPYYFGNSLFESLQNEYVPSGSIVGILRTPAPTKAMKVWGEYTAQRDRC